MQIKRIEFLEEIRDVNNDNIDVLVENETGYNYIVTVGTPQDLLEEMKQEKMNFVRPGTPMIIVKKLTEEIIMEAIQAYAEYEVFWLKLQHFAIEIDISILNKMEAEHREELELDDLDGLDSSSQNPFTGIFRPLIRHLNYTAKLVLRRPHKPSKSLSGSFMN